MGTAGVAKFAACRLRTLRCCAGCGAPASFPSQSVSLPHGQGDQAGGAVSLRRGPPLAGWPGSAAAVPAAAPAPCQGFVC